MSLHDRKTFTDMDGNELFTLKNKMLSIHKSFHGESPKGYNFEVKGEFGLLQHELNGILIGRLVVGHFSIGSSKSSIHFKNAADGQEVELNIKGDWFDRSADISFDGRPVAHISRSFFNVREIFGDKQTVSFHESTDAKRHTILTHVVFRFGRCKRRLVAHRSDLRGPR